MTIIITIMRVTVATTKTATMITESSVNHDDHGVTVYSDNNNDTDNNNYNNNNGNMTMMTTT
jgi:hypothetical protein